MTIGDYCVAYSRKEVVVNTVYQRNDGVWPAPARSFLIETICAGYPLPKFILNSIVEPSTKSIVKEIVDGQQRSIVITDFYNNKLRLSKTLALKEIAGKIYDELPENYQTLFLNFSLDIDLFTGASLQEIVEAFRRLNSYTFPLNAPEKRHAQFQYGLKWTIFYFCRRYEAYLRQADIFAAKSIVRMNDTTLIAEIWHSIENGIKTTKSADLDKLYKIHNVESFNPEPSLTYLAEAFDTLQTWKSLFDGSLCRAHMIYALALAIIHVKNKIPTLEPLFESPKLKNLDNGRCVRNLTTLATEFASKNLSGPYAAFVSASTEKTNVDHQREIRFRTFCEALTREF